MDDLHAATSWKTWDEEKLALFRCKSRIAVDSWARSISIPNSTLIAALEGAWMGEILPGLTAVVSPRAMSRCHAADVVSFFAKEESR